MALGLRQQQLVQLFSGKCWHCIGKRVLLYAWKNVLVSDMLWALQLGKNLQFWFECALLLISLKAMLQLHSVFCLLLWMYISFFTFLNIKPTMWVVGHMYSWNWFVGIKVIQLDLTRLIHRKYTTQVKSVSEINVMQSQIREVAYYLRENCRLVKVLFYPRERRSI